MRSGLKEGRWVYKAPFGYKNKKADDDKKPSIIIVEEKADLVRQLFTNIADDRSIDLNDFRKNFYKNGLRISKSQFYRMLQNIFYVGDILVPAYDDETERVVTGLHEAIIDRETFDKVQDRFRKKWKKYVKNNDKYPLKGILYCAECNKKLTASQPNINDLSRIPHPYYHCSQWHCTVGLNLLDEIFCYLFEKFQFKKEILSVISRKRIQKIENRIFQGKEGI